MIKTSLKLTISLIDNSKAVVLLFLLLRGRLSKPHAVTIDFLSASSPDAHAETTLVCGWVRGARQIVSPSVILTMADKLRSLVGPVSSLQTLLCRGTLFSSVFTLLTTCIGAGTLALPYAFRQGGIIYASVVFFLIMVISIAVGLYLIESKRYSKELFPAAEIEGYEDLAEVTFGAVGRVSDYNS